MPDDPASPHPRHQSWSRTMDRADPPIEWKPPEPQKITIRLGKIDMRFVENPQLPDGVLEMRHHLTGEILLRLVGIGTAQTLWGKGIPELALPILSAIADSQKDTKKRLNPPPRD